MPTPNEPVATIGAETTRPSRLQLACPEEAPVVLTADWQPQSDRTRQGAADAPPYPSDGRRLERPASLLAIDDEKTFAVVPASAAAAEPSSPQNEAQLTPCPTKQKVLPRGSLAKGTSASLSSPFVPSPDYNFSTRRVLPSYSSSFLRPGSKFVGKQTSDRSTYEVHVDLKHVDMAESFLCGYLRIKGLTEDHPTLTTYFEGEIIGDKYGFQTCRPEWGSSEKNDIQHWSKFPAFRPLMQRTKRPLEKLERLDINLANASQMENIFMRWKEYFLVPDHRVRQISGASFEGFYYICFNQVSGTVDGIYFHAKSERFQRLQLQRVPERTFPSVEFR